MGVYDMALGPDGTVYVLDGEGLRVLALPADLSSYSAVPIPEDDLIAPYGLTVDSNGLIHVLDYTVLIFDGAGWNPADPGVKTYAADGSPVSTWANIQWHGGGKFINPSDIASGNGLVYVKDSYPGGRIQVFRQAAQSVSSANSSAARAPDETLTSPGPQDEWYITAVVRDSGNQPITGLMHEAFSVETTSEEVTPSISFVYPDNGDGNYRIALTFNDEGIVSFDLRVMGTDIQAFNDLTVTPPVDTVSPRRSFGHPSGGYPALDIPLPSEAVIDRIERLLPAPVILDPFEEYSINGPEGDLYWVEFTPLTQDLWYYDHDPADNLYKQTLRVYLTGGDRDYIDVWLTTFYAVW